MRDDDFWNRNFRHYPTRNRNFWDDHAEAMELIARGNLNIAHDIADRVAWLWRRIRRRLAKAMEETERSRHLPPL